MQKLNIRISDFLTVEVEGDAETDVVKQAAFWVSLPKKCPLCQADIIPTYRTPKTYKYYGLRCLGPVSHAVNLGQHQIDGGLYYDQKKTWEPWRPGLTDDEAQDNAAAGVSGPRPSLDDYKAAQSGQARSGHDNAPDTVRGKMIAKINELRAACVKARIDISDLNFADLGGQTEGQLTDLGKAVAAKAQAIGANQNG